MITVDRRPRKVLNKGGFPLSIRVFGAIPKILRRDGVRLDETAVRV